MDQDIVKAVLDEIVQSVVFVCDFFEESLSLKLDETKENREPVFLWKSDYSQCEEHSNVFEFSKKTDVDLTNSITTDVKSNSVNNVDKELIDSKQRERYLFENDTNLNIPEITIEEVATICEISTDPASAIESDLSECCITNKISNEKIHGKRKRYDLSKIGKNRKTKLLRKTNDVSLEMEIMDNQGNSILLSDSSECSDAESSMNRIKVANKVSNDNLTTGTYLGNSDSIISIEEDKLRQKFPITELQRSPRIYGRKVQVYDIEAPSTSTNIIVPSVIIINDYSNASSSSTYSTGEMRRRTDSNFAFLSDSDFSDIEISEQTSGRQNRAYEPSEEIEIRNEPSETTIVEEFELRNNASSYAWSTMALLKVTQLVCCITMFISIGLCRFHSKYIQVFCIIGACISIFLLIMYSYRIQIVHWKSYTIRLLLSEYIYLITYTACDTVFAIIKFEFNEEANYREKVVVMILMTSTAVAASTYCYDAILCYSLITEAAESNPEEKKVILSCLPRCSESSRAEVCDIFYTCIL